MEGELTIGEPLDLLEHGNTDHLVPGHALASDIHPLACDEVVAGAAGNLGLCVEDGGNDLEFPGKLMSAWDGRQRILKGLVESHRLPPQGSGVAPAVRGVYNTQTEEAVKQ